MGPATEAAFYATALAANAAGNLFIGDSYAGKVRKVDPAGMITAYAGPLFPSDGGINAASLAVDSQGNLYIVDLINSGPF